MEKPLRAHNEPMQLGHSSWISRLARIGLLAQGVSYGIVGVLAILLATGHGGKATSRQGALKTLADESGGKLLIILLAFGFAAYAAWRLAQALFDRDDDGAGKRLAAAGKAAIYIGLTFSAVAILTGSGSGSSGGGQKEAAGVLGWPGGRWLVGAAGVAVCGAALYQFFRAATKKFMRDIKTHEMSAEERRWTERLGVVGLGARGVVFGVVGWFLLKAAAQYDPHEAVGIGGALSRLANASYGAWLLGVTAAGLVAFAVFCLSQARYRRV